MRCMDRFARPGSTEARYSRNGIPSRRQLSTTDRMAAALGPASSLPTWIQFLRPTTTGRIEFSFNGGPRTSIDLTGADSVQEVANRINGGEAGIQAGPSAQDLKVESNRIGLDAAETGSELTPSTEAIAVKAEGTTAGHAPLIARNRLAMAGGNRKHASAQLSTVWIEKRWPRR